jgi:hypothetical protein
MLRKILYLLFFIYFSNLVFAQKHEIQIGVQTGLALPMGQFASGYGLYIDNGYAANGYTYKIYADCRIVDGFCLGINYLNFTNGIEEGNIYAGFNNAFTTINTKTNKKYETDAFIGSIMLKGKETPLFIKAYGGFGRSKSAEITGSNTVGSLTLQQSTSSINLIYGFGAGIYVPIENKFFIEIEGNYLLSTARPNNIFITNNNTKETFSEGDISYNQTVVNLNIGVGIFLFRE